VGADPSPWVAAISPMKVSGLWEGSEQVMASCGKGKACLTSVLDEGMISTSAIIEKLRVISMTRTNVISLTIEKGKGESS
jgi:hypothetical protein